MVFMKNILITTLLTISTLSCKIKTENTVCEQWKEIDIAFTSEKEYINPYTDVEFWVEFTNDSGEKLIRPGFWDGGNSFKVRFASPDSSGIWQWTSFSSDTTNVGLHGKTGVLKAKPYTGSNELLKNGLLRMSPGKRNVTHANGKTFLMIGDTPWGLPWRGTVETVTEYATKRQSQGFNTALLMSLQPDRDAKGPRSRTLPEGFDVAFEDLPSGHINQLNTDYFKTFDTLRNILIENGIVPVFQPVFHGFGWKGQKVLGWDMEANEYARYCRYLVARYGASPAMWLVSADSDGRDTGVIEGGIEIEKWDAYQQPLGHHYSPYCEVVPDWWDRPYTYITHQNKVNQDKDWLDFQWCQTGHGGEHQPWKVAKMHDNHPVKAVANGEPTYEGIRDSLNGAGWWQGHEAWLNFTSGGTMGVVYGAGGLWNWMLFQNEPGWPEWANSKVSWKEAVQLPGANYVGYLGKALAGLDLADIEKHPELAGGQLCLAKPGKLFIVYLPEGGSVNIDGLTPDMKYRWFDPVKGTFGKEGNTSGATTSFSSETKQPIVLIISK